MKNVFCTLYNSLYLDKGLVLYESLKKCSKNSILYVLCMDDKCFEVLSDISEENLIPILLQEVENEKMKEAKQNRSIAEYCWTCSSRLIEYVLDSNAPDSCTYIDADMYFFNDPQCLIDEMMSAGKSAMVVPHRFPKETEHIAVTIGTYCVEFNTFLNNDDGKKILNHWHNLCLECCSNLGDGIHWGDQKYLDILVKYYPEQIHVCEHVGAGVAPWNIMRYKGIEETNYMTTFKDTGIKSNIVFYHYQALSYIGNNWIETGVSNGKRNIDYDLVDAIYGLYLSKIEEKRTMLCDKYNINLIIRHHPSAKNNVKYIVKQSALYRLMCNAFLKYVLVYTPYYVDRRYLFNQL